MKSTDLYLLFTLIYSIYSPLFLHSWLHVKLRVQTKAAEYGLKEDIQDITQLASSSKVNLKTLEKELMKLEKNIFEKKERAAGKGPLGAVL